MIWFIVIGGAISIAMIMVGTKHNTESLTFIGIILASIVGIFIVNAIIDDTINNEESYYRKWYELNGIITKDINGREICVSSEDLEK